MSEQTITGALDGITEKASGWFEITVAVPGKQYPIKLATKRQELVELARAAGQNVMEWTYNEVESEKINEHTGKPYVNRYFEGVAPVGSSPPAANAGSSAPRPAGGGDAMTKEEWARKDSAIHRMAATKVAADALKHTVPADPSSEDLARFVDRVKTVSYQWWKQADAVRAGDDSDVPFLSEHDDGIPY